jgi:rhodanese-related sulfurtransferase
VRFFAVVLVLCLAAPAFAQTEAPSEAPSIAPSELNTRRESGEAPVVIDVRTAEEYAAGHIPGAINIPYDQVAERISEVEAPHGVALYCRVGPRARKGEAALLSAGYTSVLHIEGGFTAWKEAGLPVEGAE